MRIGDDFTCACGRKQSSAKRKATMALREVVQAARKYVRAEDELERVLREEKTQTHKEPVKCTV